jgi:hypothetical protein
MPHGIDEQRLGALSEQSDDLHSDAMKLARQDLADYVDASQEAEFVRSRNRERFVTNRGLIAAGIVGAGMVAVSASPAFAAD